MLGLGSGDMGMPVAQAEQEHEFKQAYPDTFSPKQTVEFNPQCVEMLKQNCENHAAWKKALPSAQTQGTIYEDQVLWVAATMQ